MDAGRAKNFKRHLRGHLRLHLQALIALELLQILNNFNSFKIQCKYIVVTAVYSWTHRDHRQHHCNEIPLVKVLYNSGTQSTIRIRWTVEETFERTAGRTDEQADYQRVLMIHYKSS